MQTVETILLILLVADAIALATLILLQQGKGADIGAAFGSGGANTVFGATGGSFLMKLTTWLAIGFFVITFGLAYAANERATGLRDAGLPFVPPPVEAEAPMPDDVPTELTGDEEALDSDVPAVPEG